MIKKAHARAKRLHLCGPESVRDYPQKIFKQMKKHLCDYFGAEKQSAQLLIGLGLAAIVLSLLSLAFLSGAVWKGLAVPLIGIAVIQLVVGGTIYFRTDKQLDHLLTQLKDSPEKLMKTELPRMEKVCRSFGVYRKIEILLLFLGLLFCFMSVTNYWSDFMFGSGAGLALQSGIMLAVDLFAEWRAGLYVHKLRQMGR